MARIGFVGLGNMGLPMATNLVRAGHEVMGFDLAPAAVAALVEAGGTAAGSAREAAGDAAFVITMLPEGRHVRAVYLGDEGLIAAAGKTATLIDCSTIDVDSARAVHAQATAAGIGMLDAPVSGGVGGAVAGTLTFMAGGPQATFETARPILEVMGRAVIRCGEAGSGQAAKICNNMMLGIQMISVCEAMALADRLGLARERLFEVSSQSSGQCWSLTTYCPVPGPVPASPANRGYQPGFTAAMMLKDLKLAAAAAQSTDQPTPLGVAAAQYYQLFANQGFAELDFSAIFQLIRGLPSQD